MNAIPLGDLVDDLPDSILVIDSVGTIRAANRTGELIFGQLRSDWIGRNLAEGVHPDDLQWAASSLASVATKSVGTPIELRIRAVEGWRLVEAVGRPIEINGEPLVVLSIRDITRRRQWEVANDDTARFRAIVQNAAGLTMLTDAAGGILSVSMALTRLTGRDPEAVIGSPIENLVIKRDRPLLRRRLEQMVATSTHQSSFEVSLSSSRSGRTPCQLTVVNLLDDPTISGFVISAQDISELWQTRAELEHLVRHDPLTGLSNRIQLQRELTRLLNGPGNAADSIVVAFLDLDRFKPVNDLYGHDAGDELLVQVAQRLRDALRPSDLVARLGGDEFVVVARGQIDAEVMRSRLEALFSDSFELPVGPVHVTASIGVALATPGDDVGTLLAEADLAMYTVKHNLASIEAPGRTVTARRRLAEQVKGALDANEFVPYYQPIARLENGAWSGFEVLARWNHPERGLLSPGDFLGIVEDIGLSGRLGTAMLRQSLEDLTRLQRATGLEPSITLNASADEVADAQYAGRVCRIADEHGLDHTRLTIEISERSMLNRGGHADAAISATLTALRRMSFGIAVDDFGTGYSSLQHLIAFPLTMLKIDRSFVAGVVNDPQRRSVVAALAGLASTSGLRLVAEGVETVDQVTALRSVGCTFGQGYHFARPMPMEAMLALHAAIGGRSDDERLVQPPEQVAEKSQR